MADRLRLLQALPSWVAALEDWTGQREQAVRLLNQLIFRRALEELGCSCGPPLAGAPLLHPGLDSFRFTELGFDVLGHVHERYLAAAGVRRDRGIFYTRPEVVLAMVRRTVGRLAAAVVEEALSQARAGDMQASIATIEGRLLRLRVLDPACGTGPFLVATAEVLAAEYRRWEEALGHRDVISGWDRKLLSGCLFGIDQDPGAIEAARLNLWLWLVRNRPGCGGGDPVHAPPEGDLRVGDSLGAGMDLGHPAFDVVLGNPPYLGEEDHKALFRSVAESPQFGRYYEGKMDYACFFVHLGLDRVRQGGLVSFILPSYLLQADGAKKLNRRLAEEVVIEESFDFGPFQVFAETAPGQNNLILVLRKDVAPDSRPQVARLLRVPRDEALVWDALRGGPLTELLRFSAPPQRELLDGRGALRLAPAAADEICQRIALGGRPLHEHACVDTGIQAGPNDVTRKALKRLVQERRGREGDVTDAEVRELCASLHIRPGEGVFVLTREEVHALGLSEAERWLLRPFHPARQIRPYVADPVVAHEILYLTEQTCPSLDGRTRIGRHLQRFRALMEGRRETRKGIRPYFHLHWPRDERIFQGPKLVGVRQTREPCFAHVAGPYFVDLAVNVITEREGASGWDLWALLAVLNSAVARFWFYHRGKRKGDLLQIDGKVIEAFPLPPLSAEEGRVLSGLARRVNGDPAMPMAMLDEVDRRVRALYELSDVPLADLRNPPEAC